MNHRVILEFVVLMITGEWFFHSNLLTYRVNNLKYDNNCSLQETKHLGRVASARRGQYYQIFTWTNWGKACSSGFAKSLTLKFQDTRSLIWREHDVIYLYN